MSEEQIIEDEKLHRKIRRKVLRDGMDAINKGEFDLQTSVNLLTMIETARIADALEKVIGDKERAEINAKVAEGLKERQKTRGKRL